MRVWSKNKSAKTTVYDIQNRDYGITLGKYIKVKAVKNTLNSYPPWNGDTYIVKITKEYPFFFSGIVYPHYRENNNISDSYGISISKVDIAIGEVRIS